MVLGKGANNFVELLALKLLLCFGLEKNCTKLQIFGVSMVVINWVNRIQNFRTITLSPIFEEVCRLMANFDTIICRHVYMERNSEADKLSKKGVLMELGTYKILDPNAQYVCKYYHRPFIDPK